MKSGALGVAAPVSWKQASAPSIPGLRLGNGLSVAPSEAGGLTAGTVRRAWPTFLPAPFRKAIGAAAVKRRQLVKIGGLSAYRYPNVAPKGYAGSMTVYAIPQGKSEWIAACWGASAAPPQQCEDVAASLSVDGAEDYDLAPPADVFREASMEMLGPYWGKGYGIEIFAPTLAEDPASVKWWGRMERSAASPGMAAKLSEMFLDIDVRAILPSIRVPTLVMHRHGDPVVDVRAGRWLAERIPGARFLELPGRDHVPFSGDAVRVTEEVEEFLTGTRPAAEPDRVLATVMFTDIVGSTERAAELGDRAWRDVLERHHDVVRTELERHRGREVKTTGDGFLATFDGPARAIRCSRAMAEALRDHGVEIRVGLHTGEIEVIGEDVGGIAVHIAARVAALAGAGETLVSSTVKDLVAGSGISFSERGTHTLKGVPEEWRLYEVVSA